MDAQTMDGRTHVGLAQPMPQTGQGWGKPQPRGPRLPAPRLHPPHGQKDLQDLEMFPDRLLEEKESVTLLGTLSKHESPN